MQADSEKRVHKRPLAQISGWRTSFFARHRHAAGAQRENRKTRATASISQSQATGGYQRRGEREAARAHATPPEKNIPFTSWAQVTSDFSFGADTSMDLDTGTLLGEKRSHPTAEILNTTSPSKRKQLDVIKQAKGTSASLAVKYSLGAQQTVDIGQSIAQEPKGAVPERDKRAINAQVTASAAQGGACDMRGIWGWVFLHGRRGKLRRVTWGLLA
ncbi:hypothetical protein CYMTET_20277 [Cymbomonas tetramitiformis]|uniref:Uncharacterized protein n=1 Tax=Cymbomonas tetramitiformis TaxID=36881 RepID=A0AAE0L4B9_9CHLO|nr:hypothetical protein CYMTET_20277 [Cymbomonas tetramitiformis]